MIECRQAVTAAAAAEAADRLCTYVRLLFLTDVRLTSRGH